MNVSMGGYTAGTTIYRTSATKALTGDTHSSFVEGDNYVLFNGIVPTVGGTFTLNVNGATRAAGGGASCEATLNGFELGLVAIPEPSAAGPRGAFDVLGLLRRRRS